MSSLFTSEYTRALICDTAAGSGLLRIPTSQGAQIVEMAFSPTSGATTASSGIATTAAYTGADLGAVPIIGMVTFSLTAGAANTGSAVLISNPNGLLTVANITDGSLHIVSTETKVDVGIFSGGVLTVTTINFIRNLTKDGSTKYRLGFSLSATSLTVYLPDGQVWTDPSASYYNAAGRYCQFESYTSTLGGTRATFWAAGFNANQP